MKYLVVFAVDLVVANPVEDRRSDVCAGETCRLKVDLTFHTLGKAIVEAESR